MSRISCNKVKNKTFLSHFISLVDRWDNKQKNSERLEYKWKYSQINARNHLNVGKMKVDAKNYPNKIIFIFASCILQVFQCVCEWREKICDKNQQWITNQIYFLFIVPVVIFAATHTIMCKSFFQPPYHPHFILLLSL